MEIVSVIVLVSIILIISYVFFDQKEGKQKKKREMQLLAIFTRRKWSVSVICPWQV